MANEKLESVSALRMVASQAYALVKGSEAIESFAAYTFEEALQRQIDRLEGGGDVTLAATAQIDKIQNDLTKLRESLDNAPATYEDTLEITDEDNVNTAQ